MASRDGRCGQDSFGSKGDAGGGRLVVRDLPAGQGRRAQQTRLPYSLKILLENLLRTEDGANITADHVRALAAWDPTAEPDTEIQFTPARVVMQDFTGVPCVVDLATMREAMQELGGDAARINPLAPGRAGDRPLRDRRPVRGARTRSSATSSSSTSATPSATSSCAGARRPSTTSRSCRRAPGSCTRSTSSTSPASCSSADGVAYPDTLVGTDSHTTMVNGLGVLGWGVGGIEAEAAMLGQPVSMLIPKVVGFKLVGELPEGATATDLVLTITEMLRKHGVVGKFVEFYGEGVAAVPLANRATIGNMSPEYGSTVAIFPIDDETVRYLRMTGRDDQQVALVEAYAKEQGLWHDPAREPAYQRDHRARPLDRRAVDRRAEAPAGPGVARPTRRPASATALGDYAGDARRRGARASTRRRPSRSRPATRRPYRGSNGDAGAPHGAPDARRPRAGRSNPATGLARTARSSRSTTAHVVIAAITSCTNTSNPSVMIGAALLAKKAVERGLTRKPWVKTTLAPGSKVVMDYYERAGLTPYLDKLGFNLVGYGCTTCIGNSGPLQEPISKAVNDNDLAVVSVLSGNRNFEGRINPDVKMNYLVSPPLVVAYALAGSMDIDITTEPLGQDTDGNDVLPAGHLAVEPGDPGGRRLGGRARRCSAATTPTCSPATSAGRTCRRRRATPSSGTPSRRTSASRRTSTGCRPSRSRSPTSRAPGCSPCWATRSPPTTSRRPARSRPTRRPATTCSEHGVERRDFNSYGSRRGNHEVMIRGTFANIRLRNQLAPGTEGGFTRDFTAGGEVTSIYDAAQRYAEAGHAAGHPRRQGVRLRLVARLGRQGHRAARRAGGHRRVLRADPPLQPDRHGRAAAAVPRRRDGGVARPDRRGGVRRHRRHRAERRRVAARGDGAHAQRGTASSPRRLRIDTPGEADYYRHGGIMQYVLRSLLRT